VSADPGQEAGYRIKAVTDVYEGGQRMDKLTENLQRIISALEALNEPPGARSEPIDELLDQLFQQKIDLAQTSLNTASPPYQQAASDLATAAAKAERSARNPAETAALVPGVQQAMGKIAKLLNSVTPSP